MKSIIVAGGCFWCVEHDLREAYGVMTVTSGYSGGDTSDPTYENHTGHREVVLVEYDDSKTTYKKVLEFFIDHIDPTDAGGQFGDRGESYKSAVYYDPTSPEGSTGQEKIIAEAVLRELNDSKVYDKPSQVEILPRKTFYKAEEHHQNYAEKNAFQYSIYRQGSGRERFVNRTCQIRDEKHINWSE